MNKERRKEIASIKDELAKLEELRTAICERIAQVRDDEQEYLGNMPESFQQGDKGEKAEAAVSILEDIHGELESIDFDGFADRLDEACA